MSNELRLLEALCDKLGFEIQREVIPNTKCYCVKNISPGFGPISNCPKCKGTGLIGGSNYKYTLKEKELNNDK